MPLNEFTLARESCKEINSYPVITSEYEDQSEQRRLRNPAGVIGWEIKSPVCNKTRMTAYRSFYNGQYGESLSFKFKSPFDDTMYEVRFDGPMETELSGGTYKVTFKLKKLGLYNA